MRDARRWAGTGAVLALVGIGFLLPAGRAQGPGAMGIAPAGADPTADLSIAIEPSSWWLEAGANVTLTAVWVGIPPGCALTPIWFRWTVDPAATEGALAPVNASSSVFYASGDGSGASAVLVRSAASVDCRGNESAIVARSTAVVTVAAALSVDDLAFSRDPIAPGASADLAGALSGGDPPYRVRVAWGDGTASWANVSEPGPFSIAHTYAIVGTFEPALLATDAAGRVVAARPDEPLNVSTSFAVAIVPSTFVAEVGVPVVFGITTVDAPANFSWLFVCDDALPTDPGNAPGLVYGCSFQDAGVAGVSFEAEGASLPFPIASAALEEPVVPPPSVAFGSAPPTGEVGGTVCASVQLSGGVPPFTVAWSLVGAGTGGTELAPSDGLAYLPLTSPNAGTLALSVVVTDRLGVASVPVEENVDFVPHLDAQAAATSLIGAGDVEVNVSASAVQGVPPLVWAVVPGTATVDGSPFAGSLLGGGAFSWNGTYQAGGTIGLTVVVVDAAGVDAVMNLTAPLFSPVPPGATGSEPDSVVTVVVLVVLAAAATALLFRRRRRAATPPPPPDPVEVLREAIEPSDGVDRGLVELLAQERGVPIEVVHSTLERLKADGTVRVGRGSDGEEVLAWTRPYER